MYIRYIKGEKIMTKTYNFYNDPGHGWMKVKFEEIINLSLITKISSYSYVRNNSVYLEEDCDAPKFINALKEKGIDVKFKEFHTNRSSRIRNYNSYKI